MLIGNGGPKKLGFKRFKEMFKSITVDNGSEFLDWRSLEKSIISKKDIPRTQIYYCHPYHAWERGTNEQINGHLRRFVPKGSAISTYSKKMILGIEKWLNNYLRKIFEGKSANEILKEEFERVS